MNLNTIKTAAEAQLKGVKVEFIHEDKALKGLRLTDAAGRSLIVKAVGNYSDALKVMEHNPHVEEDRHCVEVVVAGSLISRYFETNYDADDYAREINRELSSDNRAKISKVRVLLDESGNVVRRADEPQPAAEPAEAIPF